MVPTILQVSNDNVLQVDGILRPSTRGRGSTQRRPSPDGGKPDWVSLKSIATSAGRASSSILHISIFHACLALYIAAFICWTRTYNKAGCRHSLPSRQACSAPSKVPRPPPRCMMLRCILVLAVHHGPYSGIHPSRCTLPSMVSKISINWAIAGEQALRSPAYQLFGLQVVHRGRHAGSAAGVPGATTAGQSLSSIWVCRRDRVAYAPVEICCGCDQRLL